MLFLRLGVSFIYWVYFASWKMRFGEIYSKSWKEFKEGRKELYKLIFWFYAVPAILLFLVSFLWMNSSGTYGAIVSGMNQIVSTQGYNATAIGKMTSEAILSNMNSSFASIMIVLEVAVALIMLLALSSIISALLKGGKFNFSEAVKLGKKNYWRLFAFLIVYIFFLACLFVPGALLIACVLWQFLEPYFLILAALFVILGITFMVFWIFGYFVFIDNGSKGIIKALKDSYRLVKGRWWKTFGYYILFSLIMFLIILCFSIPSLVIQGIVSAEIAKAQLSLGMYSANLWVSQICEILSFFIVFPLSLLFLKNMYLEWKKRRK